MVQVITVRDDTIQLKFANPGYVYKVLVNNDPNLRFDASPQNVVVLRNFVRNENYVLYNRYSCISIEDIGDVTVQCIGHIKNTIVETTEI